MIDDRIGIIGSTQGVNASPSPSRRNMGRISARSRLNRAVSMRPAGAPVRPAGGAVGSGAASLATSVADDVVGE